MFRPVLLAAALAALATPALADPNCLTGGGSGLSVSFGVSFGGRFTEADQMEFDRIRARRHGIDAETAERTWLGCLKVTRRDAGGNWVTEYYDPETFERKPLDLTLP